MNSYEQLKKDAPPIRLMDMLGSMAPESSMAAMRRKIMKMAAGQDSLSAAPSSTPSTVSRKKSLKPKYNSVTRSSRSGQSQRTLLNIYGGNNG